MWPNGLWNPNTFPVQGPYISRPYMPSYPTRFPPFGASYNPGLQPIPIHTPEQHRMRSGYANNRNFDDVFNSTVNTLLLENNRPPSISHSPSPSPAHAMIPVPQDPLLSKTSSSVGKRKREESHTDAPVASPSLKEVQTVQSFMLPTSKMSRAQKRRRAIEIDEDAPTKDTIISVDNHSSNEASKKVVIIQKVESKDSDGKVIPSGHKVNCPCPVHNTHITQYRPHLQSYGVTKTEPLVIDSDDEDVTIIEAALPLKVQSPTVSSGIVQSSSDEVQGGSRSDSPVYEVKDVETTSEASSRVQNYIPITPITITETCTPRRTEAQSTTPTDPVLSPRHRARLSADFKSKQSPVKAVKTLDLTETFPSPAATIAQAAAKFTTNDRRKAIERAELSSTASALSESSTSDAASTISSKSEEGDYEGLSDPDGILKMLQDIKRERPFKKLRCTPRNLYQAVRCKNFNKVLALIVEGCQPNAQVESEKGRTALHAAAASGYMDIITCLNMAGGDLNVLDHDMRTPLFDAVENNRIKTVEYLLKCGASAVVKDQGGMTLLHVAARRGHNDIIRLLLDTKMFDVNQKDDGGWTAIMWAAEDMMVETAKLLLENRGSVHLRDLELNIPLHWAAFSGSLNMALLLLDFKSSLHSVNRHGETPMHVAARENNYSCVQLFMTRGARIDITNNEGKTPLDVALPETKSRQLLETKQVLMLCQPDVKFKILSCDISRGQENIAIPCVNEVDDDPMPYFIFVSQCCEVGGDHIDWNINGIQPCKCDGDCANNPNCSCGNLCDEGKIWYDKDGLLDSEIHSLDRPLIFECNKRCSCWSYCRNRVVQKGMQYPLQLYKTRNKGWAVRALCQIPKGVFICEYSGELISDAEAETRDSDTYLFDLDCKENGECLYCIDGAKYGNISRFINHSCEPNCIPTRVFIDHHDIRFPRIAFFSSRDIEFHEEICFDYGDRFWEVKKDEFFCECGTASCNYRPPS